MAQVKRMILHDRQTQQPYFIFGKVRRYFKDISSDGYDLTSFTNCGYFGGFKFLQIEHGINDFAILEVI